MSIMGEGSISELVSKGLINFDVNGVKENKWSPRTDLNRQPADYKSAALPLSYVGEN